MIPSDWKVYKLGNKIEFINGRAFKPSDWADSGYPIIRIQNLTDKEAEPHYYNGNIEQKYIIKNGELLVAWSATLDVFKYYGEDAVLNQHIFKLKYTSDMDAAYAYFLLKAGIPIMANESHGSTMKHLTKASFTEFMVAMPSLIEQRAISTFLDSETSKIDAQINYYQSLITEMKSFKQAIISEAVTGKLSA